MQQIIKNIILHKHKVTQLLHLYLSGSPQSTRKFLYAQTDEFFFHTDLHSLPVQVD